MTHSAFDHLLHEHRALLAHYGRAQLRCTQMLTMQAREIERLQAEAIRLRARLIVRETALAYARQDYQALVEGLPGLPRRRALARQLETLAGRLQERAREVLHWQWCAAGAAGLPRAEAAAEAPAAAPLRAVLCLAPGSAGELVAQRMVEGPDGLVPDEAAPPTRAASAVQAHGDHAPQAARAGIDSDALEASLVAADLVICQTGCLGHDDYWRVQDHCRRTGKACVMVADTPQVIRWMRSGSLLTAAGSSQAAEA